MPLQKYATQILDPDLELYNIVDSYLLHVSGIPIIYRIANRPLEFILVSK